MSGKIDFGTQISGAVIALGLLAATGANASVTYVYTGNHFTAHFVTGPGTPPTPYSTSDFVSGSFVTSTALAANLSSQIVSVASFSFSDGLQTLTDVDFSGRPAVPIVVSTDSAGHIIGWDIVVGLTRNGPQGLTNQRIDTFYDGAFAVDTGEINKCDSTSVVVCSFENGNSFYNSEGIVENSHGAWSVQIAGVPESATWTMMLFGFGGLGAALRSRRKSKLAPVDQSAPLS